MSEPLTIAHITAPAAFGGLESVVHGLATGFGARGHDVHVVAVFDRGGPVTPLPLDGAPGVTQHVLEIPRRRYDRERAAVVALCRKVGARIMHSHGYRSDVVDALAAGRAGCRSVTTVHGFTGGGRTNRLFEWLQLRSFRRVDAVVPVSRTLAGQLEARGVPTRRMHVIANAWPGFAAAPLSPAEARRELGIPAGRPCIGWVGRLSAEKGIDVLLDALARLTHGEWCAAVVGAGPMLAAAQAQAGRLGIADRLRWCGHVKDAARCYRAFDVFALTSRTEGTPIALFEAMASGVPVVATRVGGVPDVVTEREAALVDSEAPAQVARALDGVLATPEAAAERSRAAGARLAEAYGVAPWLDRYEALYRSLLGGRA